MLAPRAEPGETLDPRDAVALDDDAVAWGEIAQATYLLHQTFRYEYPGPIADLQHRLVVVPRAVHGDQRLVGDRIDVDPASARTVSDRDRFGNSVRSVFARRIERTVAFEHWSLVERTRDGAHALPAAALDDPGLRSPTALTAADAALRGEARRLREAHANPRALAEAITAFVHERMRYAADTTTVETTAAEAFALGTGVCQDFAHVALAIARRAGLGARYVSGHLVGEGGTHAWVEYVVADGDGASVVAHDPTHARALSMRYVTVAVGGDYADVAPTSGVFTAPYNGELSTRKRVGAVRVRYLDGSVA